MSVLDAASVAAETSGSLYSGRSDAAGEARIAVPEAGAYVARARATGYAPSVDMAIQLQHGAALEERVRAVLEEGELIAGRVLGPDGEPVGGAYVFAHPDSTTARAFMRSDADGDADGAFELRVPRGSTSELSVLPSGSAPVFLKALPPTADLEIRTTVGGALQVRIDGDDHARAAMAVEPRDATGKDRCRRSPTTPCWSSAPPATARTCCSRTCRRAATAWSSG